MKPTPVVLTVMLFLLPLSAMAADDDAEQAYPSSENTMWGADASITYETGDFDSDHTTNTVYIPVTLKRYFSKGDVGWTIPYIYQESGPGVTAINGQPFRTNRNRAGNTHSDNGLGDMLLKGRYNLITEDEYHFSSSPYVQIKFPTADEDKGLGTGEFDETIGLESSKNFNDDWLGYLDVGYTFIGDPPGTNLDNQFAFAIGPGYRISPDTILSLLYEERTALVDDTSNARDLAFNINHRIQNDLNILGQVTAGLSDGSPDVGLTAGMSSRF